MHIQVHTLLLIHIPPVFTYIHVYMFKKKNFNINAYRSYRFSISGCV